MEIQGAPGHEAIPEGVIGTKAEAQAPEAAGCHVLAKGAACRCVARFSLHSCKGFGIFFFKCLAEIFPFGFIAARAVFRRVGHERFAGQDDQDGEDPGCHEGAAPAIEEGYEYGTKRSANSIAYGRTGIEECRTFTTFIFRQPYRL